VITFNVNGKQVSVDSAPATPLLWVDEFAQKMAEWTRYGAACPK